MTISHLTSFLDSIAPLSLQEDYDNAGLLTGDQDEECTGILCTLDVTEEVIQEAVGRKCNLILAHHPIIFRALKKLTGGNEVERVVIAAIRNNIAIYASHTNLDNIVAGVNGRIADVLGLSKRQVLQAKAGILKKLFTFVPPANLEDVRNALFEAGAGNISNYTECSFATPGSGTFKPTEGTNPFSGKIGERSHEAEIKVEVILPDYAEKRVLEALMNSHPYEEVAYDLVKLENFHRQTGSGLIGEIEPITEKDFLRRLRAFNSNVIRHTSLTGRPVKKVAVCGGAGSFLIGAAVKQGADAFVTADVKYHEFSLPGGQMLLCDVGHFESEQFTTDFFVDILVRNFPNFAVLKSEVKTNPVHYFTGK